MRECKVSNTVKLSKRSVVYVTIIIIYINSTSLGNSLASFFVEVRTPTYRILKKFSRTSGIKLPTSAGSSRKQESPEKHLFLLY